VCADKNLTNGSGQTPRLSILPKEVRARLDYSPASLDVLEEYIRKNYTTEEMKDRRNRFARDLFARYVGETLRWEMKTWSRR
jgi:hypothetical protein